MKQDFFFNLFRKSAAESVFLRMSGKLFQCFGAALLNALAPDGFLLVSSAASSLQHKIKIHCLQHFVRVKVYSRCVLVMALIMAWMELCLECGIHEVERRCGDRVWFELSWLVLGWVEESGGTML
jgi:hypothetical protein